MGRVWLSRSQPEDQPGLPSSAQSYRRRKCSPPRTAAVEPCSRPPKRTCRAPCAVARAPSDRTNCPGRGLEGVLVQSARMSFLGLDLWLHKQSICLFPAARYRLRGVGASRPRSRARSTACARVWTPSLAYMRRVWVLIVLTDTTSSEAISGPGRLVGR